MSEKIETVAVLDEVTLNTRPVFDGVLAAIITDAMEYPTELDNGFSDADMEARENIAQEIDEEQEAQRMRALLEEFVSAGTAYLTALDNAMLAVEHAAFDYWEDKTDA